jgi:hypothetical protein
MNYKQSLDCAIKFLRSLPPDKKFDIDIIIHSRFTNGTGHMKYHHEVMPQDVLQWITQAPMHASHMVIINEMYRMEMSEPLVTI